MLDERTLKRKVLFRILGSPLTVLPFMIGITTMAAGWAFGWQGGFGWFAGIAGTLGALGSFTTRFLLQGNQIAAQVASQMTLEEKRAKERALDDLDRRLTVSDNDPRPEAALRDLRQLLQVFEQARPNEERINITSLFDIQSTVGQMFDQCVRSLTQTEKLWNTASKITSTQARQPILDQREQIIADVQESLKHLSDTLVQLQSLGTGDQSTAGLKRIRQDLDHSLAIAKKVDERMSSFIKGADLSVQDQPLQ